jgi:hypothetical protein
MIPVEEFARRMRVSRSTVFFWMAKGYLAQGKAYVRIGKTIRFIWSLESITTLTRQPETADTGICKEQEVPSGRKGPVVNLDF